MTAKEDMRTQGEGKPLHTPTCQVSVKLLTRAGTHSAPTRPMLKLVVSNQESEAKRYQEGPSLHQDAQRAALVTALATIGARLHRGFNAERFVRACAKGAR